MTSQRTRQAWIALALTVLSFVIGMFVGEGLFSLLGYEPGTEAPLVPTLTAAIPAIAVMVSAPLAAWWLGRRAVAEGDPRGRIPMILGLIVTALLLLQNVAGALFS